MLASPEPHIQSQRPLYSPTRSNGIKHTSVDRSPPQAPPTGVATNGRRGTNAACQPDGAQSHTRLFKKVQIFLNAE